MMIHRWLLFLHILGCIVWFGSGITMSLVGMSVRRTPERSVVAAFAKTLRVLGLQVFMPAMAIVLVTGLIMVLDNSHWKILAPWILIGLGAFLLAFLTGAIYLSRASRGLYKAVANIESDLQDAAAYVSRWLKGYSAILLLLLLAVWDMVFKPFR